VSATLNNKRILVTRPRHQADQLCKMISDLNGEAVLFPVIDIKAVLDSENLSDRFANINEYDLIIFVSRNAVNVVFDHYLSSSDVSNQQQWLAIGSATGSALSEKGLNNVLTSDHADSESLLELPELDSESINNKKVLIVRGVGGRELLAENLTKRGALVEYAEVYQRCLPEYEIQQCHEIWQNKHLDAVIVSSNEGLENLLKLTQQQDREQLLKIPLVVMSERNATFAKQKGFISEVKTVKTKNDEGLLSALLELFGE
jgi:uroporphyrinogen-III synthase